VLKFLSVESPSPVTKQGSKWYATAVNYQVNREKIAALTNIRRQEQAQMQEYMNSSEYLMMFLARELDDPNPSPCGRCAVCLGRPLLPVKPSKPFLHRAILFLRCTGQIIQPRKQWPANALFQYAWKGNIPFELQAEEGKALCLWGNVGWAKQVKVGKYTNNRFDDVLVQASFDMIQQWKPQPFPAWVTAVSSLRRPELVPDFAQRLANKLNLPFVPAIRKIRDTREQKEMSNSYQQAHNLDGAFQVMPWPGITGAVLLVDDMVDSRWTFTVLAALLRQAGSGRVFPLALALNSLS
jgi:ATP-dependent DNA helicase RecQ